VYCRFSFGFFPHVEFISHGVSRGSTDLSQLLHVIVGFGPWLYSVVELVFSAVCKFTMYFVPFTLCFIPMVFLSL